LATKDIFNANYRTRQGPELVAPPRLSADVEVAVGGQLLRRGRDRGAEAAIPESSPLEMDVRTK
jgi:hypothetical protein